MDIQTINGKAYDVIVVGGGIAGVAASVAASREGCTVLLIEKSVNLGGLATIGLISWYEPLCDGEGKQMIGGIGEELIRLAAKAGFHSIPAEWGGVNGCPNYTDRFTTSFSPTLMALALDRYVTEAGVNLLFDTRATYPIMEGNLCKGVLVENVDGRVFYPAKVVIDASGDATIMHRAGIPCALGDNWFTYLVHRFTYKGAEEYVQTKNIKKFRSWQGCGSDMEGNGQPDGIRTVHGVNAEENTEYLLKGKAAMLELYGKNDPLEADIMMLPAMPQFRKIRHICGKNVFDGTNPDCDCGDSIGSTGDFRNRGMRYSIPYSTLYHQDYPNLLAAGRIISVEGEGWEITRVIPVCALTGQAAGTAAAIACRHSCSVDHIPYSELRATLKKNHSIFALSK